jgi:putative addiction module component (TIGR02574 family)
METTGQDIIDAAMRLSEPQRAHVVQELLDSLSPQAENLLDDVWAEELERRLAEFLQDETTAIPWAQLKSEP